MAARKLYFENVRVGDEIPAMAKSPVDRVQLARYAGATSDYNPLHVDEVYAKGLGMPSVYAPSALGMGFLGQLITDWAKGAKLKKLSTRFIKLLWPGDTVVCKGRVSDRHGEGGRYHVELEVWAENQKGELALKGAATLQVYYSADDEARAKAGQPPIVVNVARQSILTPEAPKAPAQSAKPAAKPKPSASAKKKPAVAAKKKKKK